MRTHHVIKPVHFTMCVAGVCKLTHGPTEAVQSWLSRPEIVSAMLLIYIIVITVDLFALGRWALDRIRNAPRRVDHS